MQSFTTENFWTAYYKLPASVREQAREAYKHFSENPQHPGLQFKRVHPVKPVFSVRISSDYRALGIVKDNMIVWFWIGTHANYEKLIATL